MAQFFHVDHSCGKQSRGNAPVMENVERRSCPSVRPLQTFLFFRCSRLLEHSWVREVSNVEDGRREEEEEEKDRDVITADKESESISL